MDALDMRILRHMGTTPFARGARSLEALRPSAIAKALGTTRQTVEARLANLEEIGVLQGYAIWPNLNHLGVEWNVYHWRVPDEAVKARAFAELPLRDGIVAVYSFLGPDLCVDIRSSSREERDAIVARISTLTQGVGPFTLYLRASPPVTRTLTALDWRVLSALRGDPRARVEDVAHAVGVSARTIKRHLDRMARERAFDVTARVSLAASPHPLPLAMLFHFTQQGGRATAAELTKRFDERCIDAWVPSSAELGNWDMSIYATSPAEIPALRAKAQAVPGVARVEILLYTGARVDERWLDDEIAARAKA